jgi:two-component system, NtrC family, response regulator AtoC
LPPKPQNTLHSGEDATDGERVLVIIGTGHVASHPLPDGTTLVVGRDEDCDVCLAHPKISRRHASFHGGPPLAVEDLGSTNGLRIEGTRAEPGSTSPLRPGQSVQVGPFVAMVVHQTPDPTGMPLASIAIQDPTPVGVPEVVERVAQSGVSVLITGETGAGKEVLARTIHELSGRKGTFVGINCAALGENLLESELFGYERGAFTGANISKPGLFEVAAGGTVLLDEIGELSGALQAKLLRVLETRQVYRLGGVKPVALDARFLAATHRDLAADIPSGRFRSDLYFRVNGITLTIAPLRHRRKDIPALAEKLMRGMPGATGKAISAAALDLLTRHAWPGNVRELRTVLERALLLCTGAEIQSAHIVFDRVKVETNAGDELEEEVAAAAASCRGNVTEMAKTLKTSRSQVRRLVARFRIDLDRFRT